MAAVATAPSSWVKSTSSMFDESSSSCCCTDEDGCALLVVGMLVAGCGEDGNSAGGSCGVGFIALSVLITLEY